MHVAFQRWVILSLCFTSCTATAQDAKRTPLKRKHRELIAFLLCKVSLLPFLTAWPLLTERGILVAVLALQSSALASRNWEELLLCSHSACTAWILTQGRSKAPGAQPEGGDAPPELVSSFAVTCAKMGSSSKYNCWKMEGL